jgi:hypothetical protein
MASGYPRYPNDGPYQPSNTPSNDVYGRSNRQQQQPYDHAASPANYGGNTPSTYAPGHEHIVGGGGYVDMYEDGERSPLTANAQHIAGYPPSMMSASTTTLNHQPSQGYQNIHPGASTPGFLKHDPYGPQDDYGTSPHVGFSRPSYPARTSTADSEAEWQKRARMPTRGKTTKVKLTKQGNFVHEYPVPNPIVNSVEAKWRASCELRMPDSTNMLDKRLELLWRRVAVATRTTSIHIADRIFSPY